MSFGGSRAPTVAPPSDEELALINSQVDLLNQAKGEAEQSALIANLLRPEVAAVAGLRPTFEDVTVGGVHTTANPEFQALDAELNQVTEQLKGLRTDTQDEGERLKAQSLVRRQSEIRRALANTPATFESGDPAMTERQLTGFAPLDPTLNQQLGQSLLGQTLGANAAAGVVGPSFGQAVQPGFGIGGPISDFGARIAALPANVGPGAVPLRTGGAGDFGGQFRDFFSQQISPDAGLDALIGQTVEGSLRDLASEDIGLARQRGLEQGFLTQQEGLAQLTPRELVAQERNARIAGDLRTNLEGTIAQSPEDLAAIGQNQAIAGTLRGQLQGGLTVDPFEQSLRDREQGIREGFISRTEAALAGDLPVNPALLRDLEQREALLGENLRRSLGPDFATSTPGQNALNAFERERTIALEGARRSDLTMAEQLGIQREQNLRGQQLSDIQATGGRIQNLSAQEQLIIQREAARLQEIAAAQGLSITQDQAIQATLQNRLNRQGAAQQLAVNQRGAIDQTLAQRLAQTQGLQNLQQQRTQARESSLQAALQRSGQVEALEAARQQQRLSTLSAIASLGQGNAGQLAAISQGFSAPIGSFQSDRLANANLAFQHQAAQSQSQGALFKGLGTLGGLGLSAGMPAGGSVFGTLVQKLFD
jgi:hypothetical protein